MQQDNYYLSRKPKLLKTFDKVFNKYVKKYLTEHYNNDFAETIVRESRKKFEEIIPGLPYAGKIRENYFSIFFPIVGGVITFYKAMKSHDKTVDEVMKINYRIMEDYFNLYPRFLWWFVGKLWFSKFMFKKMTAQAERSQKREYPQDFVYTVIKGDGKDFDWKIRYTKCPLVEFFKSQGVEEIAPYCNIFDYAMFKAFGVGVSFPEGTFGLGCNTCVEQYKKGRKIELPERIRKILG